MMGFGNWKGMRGYWLVLFVLLANLGIAQQRKVEGSLKTRDGSPVAHATVMLKHTMSQKILGFKSSDANGRFQLAVPDTANWSNLALEVNHLGYAKVNKPLEAQVTQYELRMEEQAINLKEIQVRNRPRINAAGDTLKYDVGSFARAEDRTIGDVLKRMPGMEVSESGQIKYNDKPISKFYIDGDDLLADKYAIGTKTIPHNMVERLEVLQNHQPLKVLRDKTLSEQIAINLVIKDEAKLKLTGQAKLGAGLPKQYDGELNTMLFNKKFKMLNVAKGNNIGVDLSTDFNSLFSVASGTRPSSLLSAGVGGPPLAKSRYYLNNSGSLNANNLVNLRNGLQLKSNIHAYLDNHTLAAQHETDIFSLNDTIRIREDQSMRQYPFMTELTLTANSNKDGYYINNDLKLKYTESPTISSMINSSQNLTQSLRQHVREFSNNFQYVPELKNKKILNLSWLLSYYSQPQNLRVEPGNNEDVLNNGVPFEQSHQYAEIPTWFSRFSSGYQLTRGLIKQAYRFGWDTEHQTLQSGLRLTQNDGTVTSFTGSADNQVDWKRNEFSVSGNYEYKKGRVEAGLYLPLTYQHIAYQDAQFNLDVLRNKLLFSPNLRAKIMTTAEDYISANYRYGENVGSISSIYRGAILRGYRSLQANNADLQESSVHSASLHYNFQRSISMLFINAGLSFNQSISNTIASSMITDNISQTIYIPFDNDVSSYGINGGISKYIFALGATAGLKSSWGISRSNQFINGESYPYLNESWTLSPNLEARLWGKISMTYEATSSWTVSRSEREDVAAKSLSRRMNSLNQDLGLSYSPKRHIFMHVKARNQFLKQPGMENLNYTFLDAKLRYTFTKQRIDVDLDLTNLANVKRFESYSLTANQMSHSLYDLRGRMAILKFSFNL